MTRYDTTYNAVEIPPVGPCRSFRPGHGSHWIMWQLYRSAPTRSAVVREIRGTEITLQVGEEVLTWQHHEPARLLVVLRRIPRAVRILDQCTAILVDHGGSTFWFYCAPGVMEDCVLP